MSNFLDVLLGSFWGSGRHHLNLGNNRAEREPHRD